MKRFAAAAKRALRFFTFLLPALLACCLLWLCNGAQGFADFYTEHLFPALAAPVALVTSLFPFSLTELLCVVSIPGAAVLVAVFIVRLCRGGNRGRTVARGIRFCGWLLSSAFLAYMLFHGLNFYRNPLWQTMSLPNTPKTVEQLASVCEDLAKKASAEREGLSEDLEGVMRLSKGIPATLSKTQKVLEQAKNEYPFLRGYGVRPKGVVLSHLWSYTGITGMYFPFFIESNINIDTSQHTIPHTVCHELAHTYGFAREDEANFIGYLLCAASESQEFRYSGYLAAYVLCSNTLYQYDREAWEKCVAFESPGVRRDLNAQSRYWSQFQGKVLEVSTSVNDTFLKAQNQQDGVFSYSRAVALILAQYEQDGFFAS